MLKTKSKIIAKHYIPVPTSFCILRFEKHFLHETNQHSKQ